MPERLEEFKEKFHLLKQTVGLRVPAKKLRPLADPRVARDPELQGWSDHLPGNGPDYLYVPKALLSRWFSRYEAVLPVFPELPAHALVGIDVHAMRESAAVELYILEAHLFEDLATLWNTALRTHWTLEASPTDEKVVLKAHAATLRAAAKACFGLLEGYLNGVAYGSP